jgi:hypothetical protein
MLSMVAAGALIPPDGTQNWATTPPIEQGFIVVFKKVVNAET